MRVERNVETDLRYLCEFLADVDHGCLDFLNSLGRLGVLGGCGGMEGLELGEGGGEGGLLQEVFVCGSIEESASLLLVPNSF